MLYNKNLTVKCSKRLWDFDNIPNLTLFFLLQFCSCKEFISHELLKTLALAKITDGDMAQELYTIFRMLQYNIKALLQQSGEGTVSADLTSSMQIKLISPC